MQPQNSDYELIKAIKAVSNKQISITDEIASVLDLSYDAAYRRVNGKTSISFNEALKLLDHYKISLNQVYKPNNPEKLLVTKTIAIKNAKDLENYFNNISDYFDPKKDEKKSIIYCAKDLPIFYVLRDNLISKFKLYVWLYMLDKDMAKKNIPFSEYNIPKSLIEASQKTGRIYYSTKITEFWNSDLINNTINQITFFYDTQLLNYENAVTVCMELKKTIQEIEKSAHSGRREGSNTAFNIYYNDLLLQNNNVLVLSEKKKSLFTSYSFMRYYITSDQKTCEAYDIYLKNKMKISKLISKTGIKERILFFNKKYEKIDQLLKKIEEGNKRS